MYFIRKTSRFIIFIEKIIRNYQVFPPISTTLFGLIEIYNPTLDTVNLSKYTLIRFDYL